MALGSQVYFEERMAEWRQRFANRALEMVERDFGRSFPSSDCSSPDALGMEHMTAFQLDARTVSQFIRVADGATILLVLITALDTFLIQAETFATLHRGAFVSTPQSLLTLLNVSKRHTAHFLSSESQISDLTFHIQVR